MSAIRLTGIVKSWGSAQVLRGADLELEPGARAVLSGSNGTGKTTLLRVAAGLIEPEAGTMSLLGMHPIRDRRGYQSALGYLPAGNGGLYARLTAKENLEFWGAMGLLCGPARASAVRDGLDRFGLTEHAGRRVDRLSMGQRQRVRLAATFLHAPRVVLLDEPHTSLDEAALGLLRQALDDHHERGGASLWCAPAVGQVGLGADISWRMEDGRVVPA